MQHIAIILQLSLKFYSFFSVTKPSFLRFVLRLYQMADCEGFTPIKFLKDKMNEIKIRVVVFLLWTQCFRDNPSQISSMEMILMDCEV